ncbi:MAG: GNAT family N-acetyltransferase [Pseudoflavonifractor sp.]|nr:GNAT family N-acetyltransferase [Alloprevotella sp.]MCM1116395.1 GNAT family N-acetyltransferase [Pseudoflavonifractor sp.]
MIRPIIPADDAEAIARIYAPFVTDTDITFETTAPSPPEMRARLEEICADFPGLLWQEPDGQIAGYCYAHHWKVKAAYNPTLETTIYISPAYAHRGIGLALMQALIDACRRSGTHSLIACITEGNIPSYRLHERLGFSRVSHFSQVGYKHGRLLDVVDYQLIL